MQCFLARLCPEFLERTSEVIDILGCDNPAEIVDLVIERADLRDLDGAGFKKLLVHKFFRGILAEKQRVSLRNFLDRVCNGLASRASDVAEALGLEDASELVELVTDRDDLSDLHRLGLPDNLVNQFFASIIAEKGKATKSERPARQFSWLCPSGDTSAVHVSQASTIIEDDEIIACAGGSQNVKTHFSRHLATRSHRVAHLETSSSNPSASSHMIPLERSLSNRSANSHIIPLERSLSNRSAGSHIIPLERSLSNRSAAEFLEAETESEGHIAVAAATWSGVKSLKFANMARQMLQITLDEEAEIKNIVYEGRQPNLSLSLSGFMVKTTISMKLSVQKYFACRANDAVADLLILEVPQLPRHFEAVLSGDGFRLLSEVNAGGSSEVSEAWAFEVLNTLVQAQLVATEMELQYLGDLFPCLSGSMGRTDFAIRLPATLEIVGVSITRAMGFRKAQSGSLFHAFGPQNAEKLLQRKLERVLTSTAAAVGDVSWNRQILYIWTCFFKDAAVLRAVFDEKIHRSLRANTLILVFVCADNRIFCNS